MLLRLPSYYKEFACIADRCKDSCCIGWEIDIDEETFAYYGQVEGPFGDRLRSHMTSGEENSFVLQEGGRCPLLNTRNLCDICLELGETSLCEICTEYPRFTLEYGDVREKCLGISCEEVGRIMFEKTEATTFEEMEIHEAYDGIDEEDEEDWSSEEEAEAQKEWEDEVFHGNCLEAVRKRIFQILQDRSQPVEKRAMACLKFAKAVQEAMNQERWDQLCPMADSQELPESEDWDEMEEAMDGFTQRRKVLEGMEILDEEWRSAIAHVYEVYEAGTTEDWQKVLHSFRSFYEDREYEYEHLLVYFVFRYMMKSVFDFQMLSRIQLGILSFLVIRDMDAVRFLDQNGQFTLEDRIDVARIYSKEVEHSEDNLEYLADAFMFDEGMSPEEMVAQLQFGV